MGDVGGLFPDSSKDWKRALLEGYLSGYGVASHFAATGYDSLTQPESVGLPS